MHSNYVRQYSTVKFYVVTEDKTLIINITIYNITEIAKQTGTAKRALRKKNIYGYTNANKKRRTTKRADRWKALQMDRTHPHTKQHTTIR